MSISIKIKQAATGTLLVVIMLFGARQMEAQNILTLEQAVENALSNNNNIKIAKNNTESASIQATKGNAGYAPTISSNTSLNGGITNSTLKFLTAPDETKFTGAENFSYGTGVTANYTIFGGLGTINTFRRLQLTEENASIQERLNIESVLLQTIQAYCQVLQAQNNYEIAQTSLKISSERIKRARTRFELAGTTKLELLNAQVDFNTDSITIINAANGLETAKYRLLQLMNVEDKNIDWKVQDIQLESLNQTKEQILQAAKENNASLLNANYNSEISQTQVSISKAPLMPRLTLQGSYNFTHSENAASIIEFSEASAFSGVLQLSIPIFDGHKKTIQYQNAKIQAENAELTRKEAEINLEKDINVAASNYERAKSVSSMDKTTIEAAKLNFDRTKELFDNGQVTGLQFREAQLNLLRSESQAANNKINVKLAEVELMRLSGQLIK